MDIKVLNKRLLTIIFVIVMALCSIIFMAACNDSNNENKVAVIYYSASGNTDEIAKILASKVDGDIYRLETEEDVPDEFEAIIAYIEQRNFYEHRQDEPWTIKTEITNLNEYDVIFLGYPLWYGQVAYPMQYFIENNDLAGKVIIPFVTSDGSGLMNTPQYIQSVQPKSIVKTNGLEIDADYIVTDDYKQLSILPDLEECERIIDAWLEENYIIEN